MTVSKDQSKCPGHDRPECASCCWPKAVLELSDEDQKRLRELLGAGATAEYVVIEKPSQGYTAVDMTTAAAQGFRDGQASASYLLDECRSYLQCIIDQSMSRNNAEALADELIDKIKSLGSQS